ncbi:MAG TPA: D-aminoacyl-tRNA deacylase [Acidimicrobiales bacterium]|nr:D-aminoacyl-tRNA deacylase [Acidimicrobiales bacterium]
MRAVVQRVVWARVVVAGEIAGALDRPGLCVLLGVTHSDTAAVATDLGRRIWNLRILADADGRMNVSAAQASAPILVISQFTLYGDTSGGRRPSWMAAAPGHVAEPLVDQLVAELRALGAQVSTGVFGADMLVELANDGPVTLILESGPRSADTVVACDT